MESFRTKGFGLKNRNSVNADGLNPQAGAPIGLYREELHMRFPGIKKGKKSTKKGKKSVKKREKIGKKWRKIGKKSTKT